MNYNEFITTQNLKQSKKNYCSVFYLYLVLLSKIQQVCVLKLKAMFKCQMSNESIVITYYFIIH